MKTFYFIVLFSLVALSGQAQLNTGGIKANFGIDADLKASYRKYGTAPGAGNSDDWFTYNGATGKGVIDVSGAAMRRTQLMQGQNISFTKGMSVPKFTVVDGRMWLDAIYARDYTKGAGTKDSTAFNNARIAQNPNQWTANPTQTDANSDIVDAFAHFRRDGVNVTDSLWFFGGITTVGTGNSRYADFELYKNGIIYNPVNTSFTSPGLANGHTEWLFDPLGNVIQAGDILITIRYTNSNRPLVDVHIWVSKITKTLITPAKFRFGQEYHTHGSKIYGYVNVLPKLANVTGGAILVNDGYVGNQDTTFASPWGSMNSYNTWSDEFDGSQFAEVGINFTRYGLDVSQYILTAPASCGPIYNAILFKAGLYEDDEEWDRGGLQFDGFELSGKNGPVLWSDESDKMKIRDFVGPIAFTPVDFQLSITTDTITCKKPIGKIKLQSNQQTGYYSWNTLDGQIVGQDPVNKTIDVAQSGWYSVNASVAQGCPIAKVEYVYVSKDMVKPVAAASIEWTDMGEPKLVGDTIVSAISPIFGNSNGVEWKWTGPDGFVSTEKSAVVPWEYAWGSFELAVKEKRNGCQDITSVEFAFRTPNTDRPTSSIMPTGKTSMWYTGSALCIDSDQPKEGNGTVMVFNANGQSLMQKAVKFSRGMNRIQLPLDRSNQLRVVMLYINGKLAQTQKIVL